MIIIAEHLIVPSDGRDAFVEAMQDLVARARQAEGCIALAITADSIDPQRVQNIEVWRDTTSLEAWRSRSNPPETPVKILEDQVARYNATDGGPVFQ